MFQNFLLTCTFEGFQKYPILYLIYCSEFDKRVLEVLQCSLFTLVIVQIHYKCFRNFCSNWPIWRVSEMSHFISYLLFWVHLKGFKRLTMLSFYSGYCSKYIRSVSDTFVVVPTFEGFHKYLNFYLVYCHEFIKRVLKVF